MNHYLIFPNVVGATLHLATEAQNESAAIAEYKDIVGDDLDESEIKIIKVTASQSREAVEWHESGAIAKNCPDWLEAALGRCS